MRWVVLFFLALVLSSGSAFALPPFLRGVEMRYNAPLGVEFAAKVATAKCGVCHTGSSKTFKNDYGKELAKFLKKENFNNNRMQTTPDIAYKEIIAALKRVEQAKAPDGRTYEERFSAGLLPNE